MLEALWDIDSSTLVNARTKRRIFSFNEQTLRNSMENLIRPNGIVRGKWEEEEREEIEEDRKRERKRSTEERPERL